MLHVNQENGIVNGLAYRARCANPAGSTTTLQLPALSGFSNDYFNNHYYIQVIKNNNSAGNAPEGDEPRKVTDYVSATGTFTTDAFSANVEVEDEILVIHESIASIPALLANLIIADFIIADRDDFDVADADANTERWDVEYITGTEGGSADINTTTAGKLMVLVNPDATPTEARYAVSHALPFYADYLTVTADLNCTWGSDSATAKALGLILSAGAAYDATNYLAVERQKGTAINRFTVSGKLNNVSVTTTSVNTTDDAVAFKVQRLDNVWRFYYSTAQSPQEDWVLISQVEDPSVYMTNQATLYLEAYSVGSADGETAQADFDNFRYYIGSGGGGQYIAGDYSSAWVGSDIDGSVLERQESLQKAVGVVTAAGGQFEEDGSTDLWDALVVDSSTDANIIAMTGNRNGAVIERLAAVENAIGITDAATLTGYEEDGTGVNLFKTLIAKQSVTTGVGTTSTFADTARTEGDDYWIGSKIFALSGSAAWQVRTIVDSTSGTLTVEPLLAAAPGTSVPYVIINEKATDYILGDNTANNAYDSSNVVVNKDGSVLERIEALLSTILAYGTFTTDSATVPADTGRTESSDYWNGQLLIPLTGNCAFQPRLIVDYTVTTDVFTLDPEHPFTAAPGLVSYVIVANDGQLVPTADVATNYTSAHVLGNKTDAIPAMNAAPANSSAIAHLKAILERLGATPADSDDSALTNIGQRDDAATNDDMTDVTTTSMQAKLRLLLARLSADAFTATIQGAARATLDAMTGALAAYLSDSGAAYASTIDPGGTSRTCVETALEDVGKILAGGGITTFPAAADIGTGVSLASAIRAILTSIVGGDDYNGFTQISGSANASLNAIAQKFATVIGIDSANTFAPSMFGATPATVEAAFAALGTALGAEFDGTPNVYDTIVTGFDSSATTANEDGSVLERLEDLSLAAGRAVSDLADYDDFDVADADANNERWDVGYLNGTEGGSADINTTTAGKLMAKVDPDATPTAAAYGAHLAQPVASKYFGVVVDVDATFGTPSGSWATVGMRVSPTTYDANNVVYIQRQNSTVGVQNRICAGAIFASANQGEIYFTTSDSAVAFKIERLDNVWRLYYSLTQYPNYVWVLLTQYEDAAEGMDSQQSVYLDAYSPGSADAETAQGNFDNFKLYLNSGGLQQAVAGDYDSTAVAADEDGSVIERLEQIQEAVNKGTGSALPANKSLLDIIGANYVDAGGGLGTDSVLSDLGDIHTHIDDVDTDLGEPADAATINGSVHSKLNGIIAALEITAAAGGKFEVDGTEGLWTQLKEIPASDGTVTWNATALASVNAEVDTALNTVVPASPTAGSLNDILSKAAGANTFSKTTDSLEMLSDKTGAFTGNGGAAQADSTKASLDLAHTDLDSILALVAATITGRLQIVSTTESLNQIAGAYPLLTGTGQAVVLEKLNLKMPTGAAGGAITSISIQTDDATPGVIISSATGAVANLTSEADLSWTGALLINVGTIINLTIAGGAHGSAYAVTVVAQYRSVVAGGTLVA